MATLTIRNLEDALKSRLRLRAASRNRSMVEEARQILRAALQEPAAPTQDLSGKIRARFSGLGDVQLAVEPREIVRRPSERADPPIARRGAANNVGKASRVRR